MIYDIWFCGDNVRGKGPRGNLFTGKGPKENPCLGKGPRGNPSMGKGPRGNPNDRISTVEPSAHPHGPCGAKTAVDQRIKASHFQGSNFTQNDIWLKAHDKNAFFMIYDLWWWLKLFLKWFYYLWFIYAQMIFNGLFMFKRLF